MQAFVAENAKDGWNGLEFAAARLTLADVLKAAKGLLSKSPAEDEAATDAAVAPARIRERFIRLTSS